MTFYTPSTKKARLGKSALKSKFLGKVSMDEHGQSRVVIQARGDHNAIQRPPPGDFHHCTILPLSDRDTLRKYATKP